MTDENTLTDELEQPVETAEEPQGSDVDWKAEARKWEKRAKDANSLRDAAEKWQEYERSLKPEQERLAEELTSAKHEAESARVQLLRYEIAAEKGIPSEAIKLLNGSSREELEESSETLMALIAKQSETKQPRPDMSQGRAVSAGGNTTADQFAAAVENIF
jgi:hypothetical protein